MPQALFTITFLVGAVMFVMGLLRLGSVVNSVSNAVMTGFVVGASLLIIGQDPYAIKLMLRDGVTSPLEIEASA